MLDRQMEEGQVQQALDPLSFWFFSLVMPHFLESLMSPLFSLTVFFGVLFFGYGHLPQGTASFLLEAVI